MGKEDSDIIIIGGGLVGLTLACALNSAGINSTIIESIDQSRFHDEKFDGRVSAIAYGSKKLFETIGVWQDMADYAGPISDIRITDQNSSSFIHYDGATVGSNPMGYIVENRFIRKALLGNIASQKGIKLLSPAIYEKIEYGQHDVTVKLKAGGNKIRRKLIVAADGRNSAVREGLGIKTTKLDYGQTAIVCTIKHEKNHQGIAIEHFMPAGPFAILPMQGGHHSSLVWTEKRELAPIFMKMNDSEFLNQVEKRFGAWLGKLEVSGPRWSYPLSLCFADEYIANRACLVGDAAHGIHPIAGQGFNLGIRDVAVLADIIAETIRLGLDVGGFTMLESYQRTRRADNLQMIAATDCLNRLFSNNITPIKLARNLGMGMIEKMPSLKKILMRDAMGILGDTPKLIRGEKI